MQWRNSNFAAVSRRPTAAAAGAQVRLLKKLSRIFFRQKMTYSSKKQFFQQNVELMAANLQLFEAFDNKLEEKKKDKNN